MPDAWQPRMVQVIHNSFCNANELLNLGRMVSSDEMNFRWFRIQKG